MCFAELERYLDPVARVPASRARVWHADLDVLGSRVDVLARCLSSDERARLERFRFARDRRRFAICRGLLRWLVADQVGIDPSTIKFCYGPYGKPSLCDDSPRVLSFNVSHSDGHALFAVAPGRGVGVDIERIRPLDDLEQIAAQVFTVAERASLGSLRPADRERGFFNGWTRKEAYIKARGDGFERPLDSFDITLAPGEPARLVRVANEPHEPLRWELSSFEPVAGYAAAVCVERANIAN